MLSVTASRTIDVAPDAAWGLLCDTSRYADYVIGTDEVTRYDGPAKQGVTYEERNTIAGPWKARTRWTIIEFAPGRMVHRSPDVPLCRQLDVVLEVTPEGNGSRVAFTLEAEPALGPVGAAFGRLMRSQVERDNRKSVEHFAEIVLREASPAGVW